MSENLPIRQAQLALSRPWSDLLCMERGRECRINTTGTTLNTNQPILLSVACVCLWQQRPVKWNRAHGLSLRGDLCLSNLKETTGCERQDVGRRLLRSRADNHRHRQTDRPPVDDATGYCASLCRPSRLWGKSGEGNLGSAALLPSPLPLSAFLAAQALLSLLSVMTPAYIFTILTLASCPLTPGLR